MHNELPPTRSVEEGDRFGRLAVPTEPGPATVSSMV